MHSRYIINTVPWPIPVLMTGRSPLSTATAPSVLQELPPSAKLVVKTLEYEGDLTQTQLAEATRLPPRTVRSALKQLEEKGLVASQISFMDARQRVYSLTIEASS